jgi:hypothetical protein
MLSGMKLLWRLIVNDPDNENGKKNPLSNAMQERRKRERSGPKGGLNE